MTLKCHILQSYLSPRYWQVPQSGNLPGLFLLSSQKSTFCPLAEKLWIRSKMVDTFYDGHDELYHHAKFGEDPTMRAGCRCENMVFVFLPAVCRIAANCRYCFLHTGQKSGFSPRRGDSLHRFRSRFAGSTDTWVRLTVQHFTSIGADGWECGPKISKFPLSGKESPRRARPGRPN